MISLEEGVELVWHAFEDMEGGEIYVKKIPSMNVVDIARAVAPEVEIEITGIRPGEKLHEQMISVEDAPFTYEYGDHYKIVPAINDWTDHHRQVAGADLVAPNFSYESNTNPHWMTSSELLKWLEAFSSK
jgi:FlaA1/EpsC-like NDP-sugar epimerase